MQSQAKAGPSSPFDGGQEESGIAASSGAAQPSDSGLKRGTNGYNTKGEASARSNRPPKHVKEDDSGEGKAPPELSTRGPQLQGHTMDRSRSMPGKAEGVATAVEASPLLESLDRMVADTSSK